MLDDLGLRGPAALITAGWQEWELDDEEGEITPTGKVRRAHMGEQFAPLIEALYKESVVV